MIMSARRRIGGPCKACGREENGKWYSPCPSEDCPSNHIKYGRDCIGLGQGNFLCYHAFKRPKFNSRTKENQ